MTKEPGIYIVTLNNDVPISINAQDPRCADKVYKANKNNVKVGKAKSLKNRRENYYKTFGKENVNFEPIIITNEIDIAEKHIIKSLDNFRVRNPVSNRKTEWLIGIDKEKAFEITLNETKKSGVKYELANGISHKKSPNNSVKNTLLYSSIVISCALIYIIAS